MTSPDITAEILNAEEERLRQAYADRVQDQMRAHGMDYGALAAAAGLTTTAVRQTLGLTKAKPPGYFSTQSHDRIAQHFQVSSHWLLTGEGEARDMSTWPWPWPADRWFALPPQRRQGITRVVFELIQQAEQELEPPPKPGRGRPRLRP